MAKRPEDWTSKIEFAYVSRAQINTLMNYRLVEMSQLEFTDGPKSRTIGSLSRIAFEDAVEKLPELLAGLLREIEDRDALINDLKVDSDQIWVVLYKKQMQAVPFGFYRSRREALLDVEQRQAPGKGGILELWNEAELVGTKIGMGPWEFYQDTPSTSNDGVGE